MLLTPWHPGQSAFPFFTDLEVAARRKMWELKSNQKKPASGKKRANHPVDFDMEMLALPLFSPSHFDGLIPHDLVSDQVEFVVEAEPLVAVAEEAIEWSDSAAAEMHYVVLLGSLKRLGAANNAEEKKDILNWIFHSDVPDEVTRTIDGKEEKILIPFTFGACCRLEGCDPDELREHLMQQCKRMGVVVH